MFSELNSGRQNIAVVLDDEKDICFLLSGILQKKGYWPIDANTLKEGRSLLITHKPEIVFIDINMPDGSGLLHLKLFRELSPSSKFIVMSAYDSHIEQIQARRNGAVFFLSKPINLGILDTILDTLKIETNKSC